MRRVMISTLPPAATLVSLIVIAACDSAPADPPRPPPPQVSVVTLKSEPVTLTRELPGRTGAFLVAEVRPQVNGIIKRRLFVEGSFVTAGQPLYEIDEAIYRAQYNSAGASLEKAKAALEAAELNAKRSAELVKIDAISVQDNETAISTLGQAKADVAAAQAAVDNSAINLAYAHLSSPISGRIGKSSVTPGALVTANQTMALATVQQLDPIYVDVNQSSSEWLQLQQEIASGHVQSDSSGAPTKIYLENGTLYKHLGKLQFADVTVDPTTGDFLLRVIVPNPQHLLMPGMYVRAVVSEGILPNGLLAPQAGIMRDPKGDATALIVAADGKVEQRSVKVSRVIGDRWLVDGGLAAGERLIVEGLQRVQPGMEVRTVEAAEAKPAAAGTAAASTRAVPPSAGG